ncbi:P-type DNA transfer ATPase VirB11 [Acinetobacter baumannii]|nr:P-type DNA transfer ATPase VirB11 [Acinetobacter baumannii]
MNSAQNKVLSNDAMVRQLLEPLAKFLQMESVTEIAINRPDEVWTESHLGWKKHDVKLPMSAIRALSNNIASYTNQQIGEENPILSAQLPDGERIQIVLPPAVEQGTVSITIRIPDEGNRSLEDYEGQGFFNKFRFGLSKEFEKFRTVLRPSDVKLIEFLQQKDLSSFFKFAVQCKKNIAVVGDTGSGKTTFMKAICQHIPLHERLVTIEDVRELFIPHGNKVHLLYSKGGQGKAKVTPSDLIASNMRMKPSRVLLAELRGGEAFDFLKLLTTGHSGSITSFHAESCSLAYDRYVFMCKEHEQATIYDQNALKNLVALTIDIIVHVDVQEIYDENANLIGKERFISEIKYDPVAKIKAQFGDAEIIVGDSNE